MPAPRPSAVPVHASPLREQFAVIPKSVLIDARVEPAAKELLSLLFCYAYPEGFAYPARRTLAQEIVCSESTISRRLRDLEKAGYVSIHYRPSGTDRRNVYVVPRAVRLPIAHKPRSEDAVRAMCQKLEIAFQERYVRKGPGHPGIDEEVWVAAQGLYDRFEVRGAELVAFLERNLAAQSRSPEAVAAAARRVS